MFFSNADLNQIDENERIRFSKLMKGNLIPPSKNTLVTTVSETVDAMAYHLPWFNSQKELFENNINKTKDKNSLNA